MSETFFTFQLNEFVCFSLTEQFEFKSSKIDFIQWETVIGISKLDM